jgi:hypothetical protein
MKKYTIHEIANLISETDIDKEAESYDNELSSLAEGTWRPIGFRDGANWVINKIKGFENND